MNPDRLLDGRLKLRHLILVTTIAEQGTLLRTAAVLHVTQPVVSRSLREVEEAVGTELFTRGPRGVHPTPAGEILIDHAHRVLGVIRTAGVRIGELERVGLEPVRVGTNLAGAYALIPNALVRLKREHPSLTVTVIEGGSEELTTLLQRSTVDLLVGRLQPRTDGTGDPLRRMRLYDEPVRLVVRDGHPADDDRHHDLADLLDHPWILPNGPSQLRSEIDDLFRALGLPLPVDVIECSTMLTVQAILHATDAIAPLPVLIGHNTPGLTVLDTDLATVPRAIGITTLVGAEPPESLKLLLEHLLAVARDLEQEIALAAGRTARGGRRRG